MSSLSFMVHLPRRVAVPRGAQWAGQLFDRCQGAWQGLAQAWRARLRRRNAQRDIDELLVLARHYESDMPALAQELRVFATRQIGANPGTHRA